VDQPLNNSPNEFLWTLLANPADDAHLYAFNLQRLVNDFPQSGILQALLAHASDDKNLRQASVYFDARSLYKLVNAPASFIGLAAEKIIVQPGLGTGLYFQPAEYSPIEESPLADQEQNAGNSDDESHPAADAVTVPEDESAIAHTGDAPVAAVEHIHHASGGEQASHEPETASQEGQPSIEHEHQLTHIPDEAVESAVAIHPEENAVSESPEPPVADTYDFQPAPEAAGAELPPPVPEAAEVEPTITVQEPANTDVPPPIPESVDNETPPPVPEPVNIIEENTWRQPEPVDNFIQTATDETETASTAVENETLVEPVIENHVEQVSPVVEEPVAKITPEDVEEHISEETFDEIVGIDEIKIEPLFVQPVDEKPSPDVDGEENLIKENIAATDFFMFDQAFGEHKQADAGSNGQPAPAVNGNKSTTTADIDHQDVSKYHDEKMPYSFMWWLDKTRKEHAGVYQPYIKPETINISSKPKKPADELQQQYFENIFHITSVEELDKHTPPPTAPYNIKRKEQVIIDRFIKEEPQIKPQSSDKLDNENKAKKSSEDRDELVTETLAGIYSDQMLYHKAIASYKKLMLKFPEKSRYFAGKIEQLEKKTN